MGGKNSKNKKKDKSYQELSLLHQSIDKLKEQKNQYDKIIVKRQQILLCMDDKRKQLKNQLDILGSETSKYNSFECKICFDRVIDVMCLPCCHTYCEECSKNMKKCFICNREVYEKVKIYN